FLFVGDAKDSSNETVDNSKTITRIQSYIDEFAEYFSPTKGYTSGFFAIATNDSYEASRWITKLNKLAKNANMNDSNGNGPDFTKIKLLNKNTWIVYW
ncbi:MAG: hypothetical protein KAR20_21855, partial [Candidatus Heimdallarchaeota archaeon]|nr:hypothetical protein [Candidatus Heimdallarchaeota archaeon]